MPHDARPHLSIPIIVITSITLEYLNIWLSAILKKAIGDYLIKSIF